MDRQSMDNYHAFENTTGGGGGGNRSSGSGGGNIITVILVVLAIMGWLFACTNMGSNKTSSSSYSTRATSSTKNCIASGCNNVRTSGSLYCYTHTCHKSGCTNKVASGSTYCSSHQPTQATTKPKTNTSTKKNTTNTKKDDPYNISEYDDIDYFYDDWYDDFDGFDDAEWYWDEHH